MNDVTHVYYTGDPVVHYTGDARGFKGQVVTEGLLAEVDVVRLDSECDERQVEVESAPACAEATVAGE